MVDRSCKGFIYLAGLLASDFKVVNYDRAAARSPWILARTLS